MHQSVQSAIEAANQGDKNKAMGFIKEVLSSSPNNVDAWLVLAAIVDQPERKRQCLNRVLSLDPINRIAREELLEMDRASMGGTPPFIPEPSPAFAPGASVDQTQDKPAPVSQPKPQSTPGASNYSASKSVSQSAPVATKATHVTLPDWAEETPKSKPQAAPQPKPASKPRAEKPLVFKYSTINRIITYFFAVIFACFGLVALLVLQDPSVFILPCGLSLLFIPAIWIVSAQVEVSEKGIRASRMFGLVTSSQVDWDEIARIKSNSMQRNLELITKKGDSVKVTTQVTGYPAIVEVLRQKRPDLFGMAASSMQSNTFSSEYGNSPSTGYGTSTAAPAFSGTRIFKKSFFKQFGLYFIIIPFGLLAAWAAFAEPEYRLGAGISAAFCFIMLLLPFFQVSSVKVEPNKLTVETFMEQKEFSARQIREIKMQSVRGRHGTVTNFVNVIPAEGKNYPLQGFSEGDEIIYGFLIQWWESYRNR